MTFNKMKSTARLFVDKLIYRCITAPLTKVNTKESLVLERGTIRIKVIHFKSLNSSLDRK